MAVIGVNGNTKVSHHSAKHQSEAEGEKQIGEYEIFENFNSSSFSQQ